VVSKRFEVSIIICKHEFYRISGYGKQSLVRGAKKTPIVNAPPLNVRMPDLPGLGVEVDMDVIQDTGGAVLDNR